mgnify:CR=1
MYNPIKKLIYPIVSLVHCTNCTNESVILTEHSASIVAYYPSVLLLSKTVTYIR